MKQLLLALTLSVISMSAFAADFVDETLAYCDGKGGKTKMERIGVEGQKECFKILCYKSEGVTGVDFSKSIDELRAELSGKGAAVISFKDKACRDYKEPTLGDFTNSGANSGSGSGSGENSGGANSGANSGSGSGANSGEGDVGVDGNGGIHCEYVTSGMLRKGDPCYKECRKHWLTRKSGTDRKKCRDCIEANAIENGGSLVVDWSKIPGGKPSDAKAAKARKKGVSVSGVKMQTGEIVCYDKNGNVVARIGSGSACPANSSANRGGGVVVGGGAIGGGGVVVSGGAGINSGSGSGAGTVVINAGGSVSGGVALPEFCKSRKKKDKIACENWMKANARFACASSSSTAGCIGEDYYNIQNRYSYDGCVNCGAGGRAKDNSWIGEAVTGLGFAASGALSSYWGSKAYQKSNEAWAGAAAAGFEQCQLHNNNYLAYLQANELPAMSPEQQAAMGCNGFQLSQYGGLGMGGMGSWYGAGYTPGYLGGMMGPYGGYNPYGMGMGGYAVGGIGGGGMYPGMGGIGGIGGGMYPGMGMAGGYGVGGGMYPGMGGAIGGLNVIGGVGMGGGGMYPGMGGGYGIGGGMYPGMGGIGGIGIAGGMGGGMYPGMGGGYGMGGGMYPGGWGSGVGQYGGGYYGGQANYWAASQQTSSYDQMLQGQGVSYQMGMSGGGYGGGMAGGGFGMAGYHPMNAGMTFGAGFNGGFGGGYGGY